MYDTRNSRYIPLSVLSAVSPNCGRSSNVLRADIWVRLYYDHTCIKTFTMLIPMEHLYISMKKSWNYLSPAGRDGELITWKPCIFSYVKIIIN